MQPVRLTSVPYIPSAPLSGNEILGIYRGKNVKLRGMQPQMYYEAYAGSENLSEPIPTVSLTGTLAFSPSSLIVTGTATSFLDELHPRSLILAGEEILSVAEVLTDTTFRTGRLPITTEVAATGEILPILGALDVNRYALSSGSAAHFDKGTILCVGSGELLVNGASLPGDALTATRRVQVALYEAATQTYDVQPVGFDTVPTMTNTDVTVVASGGTKSMSLGYYSTVVAYYSSVTGGHGNPTDTLLSGGTTGYQITVVNSTFRFDFTADVGSRPTNATGYVIYFSAFAGASSVSQVNAIQGGWFEVKRVPFTDLDGADSISFDFVDSDLSGLVSFDNDTPPDAEWVSTLDGYAVLVSTNGKGAGSGSREKSTSPGPFVAPMKATNLDAWPATQRVATEKGETIIGVVSAAGRMFVLTPNTLQAVTATSLPSAPFACRPFWKRGFQGTYNLAFVDDTLYGFTTAGMFRSIAEGDPGSESNDFAANVQSLTADWHGAFVFVEIDHKNEEVCFFSSGSRQNAQGYWETDIFPYSLVHRQWQPPVVLSDSTRDMIVSGVANVNGHLEFIAGGRRAGDTNQHDTWRYDTAITGNVPWYLVWNYMDNGVETVAKTIRKLRPKGKFTDGKVQLYLTESDTDVNVTDLETGANFTYEYTLADSTMVKQYGIQKCRARNGMMYTARVEGVSNQNGDADNLKDRFDELIVMVDVFGQQR